MKIITLILTIAFTIYSPSVYARYKFFHEFGQKQTEVQNTRWTLADWLSTKQKNRLMDQWLAAHTSANIFEGELSGGQINYETKTDNEVAEKEDRRGFAFARLYLSIIGLSYLRENYRDKSISDEYAVYLRLLGKSAQATNITLLYGLKNFSDEVNDLKFSHQFAGAQLTLNIFSFFGIMGEYKGYFEDTDEGQKRVATRSEYGAFIDVWVFRLYGKLFHEKVTTDDSTTEVKYDHEGVLLGGSLFF